MVVHPVSELHILRSQALQGLYAPPGEDGGWRAPITVSDFPGLPSDANGQTYWWGRKS